MIKLKSILCCLLAVFMSIGAVGCKSSNNSDNIDTSTITEVVYPQTDGETVSNNSNYNSQTVSNTETDQTAFEKYGFNTLCEVEVSCVKDIPTGDAEYKVDTVLTDMGTDILLMSQISCDVSGVTVNGSTITVPYSVKTANDSIALTATHGPSGMTVDFSITFDRWKLVFEDDFNGNSLDLTKWDYSPNHYRDKGYVNYWSDDMSFVKDGYLVSRAYNSGEIDQSNKFNKLEDPSNRTKYLSGAVTTKGLFECDYGYYEIYAKPHQITGMWGAFWLVAGDMGDSDAAADNTGVNGAEIDIFESLKNHGINQTVHWDGYNGNTQSMSGSKYKTEPNVFDGKFHTFALRWTPTEYVFLIDGIVTLRTDAGGICQEKGYINITSECGTWGGDWVLDVGEYSDMLVDYVRVYTTDSDK